jgi:hypothetical protein
MKFKYDEFQYETHFGKTNPVNEIKSYVELMKDLNLDLHLFYDEVTLDRKNEFENDICECTNGKWKNILHRS